MSLKHRLANFLIMYRSTPHSVTGRTPAKLLFGRPIRTKFSLLRPNLRKTVEERQRQQRKGHDFPRMKEQSFEQGKKLLYGTSREVRRNGCRES